MLAERSAPARTAGVVKADGYGLGIAHVVPALHAEGCRDFFVALAQEGVAVRSLARDARIFVLNGFFAGSESLYRDADLIPVAGSLGDIRAWQRVCGPTPPPFAMQVDTGMNRIGLTVDEALRYAGAMRSGAEPEPALVMSHLACADSPKHPLNARQIESFQRVARAFEGIESSLANSAGVFFGPQAHGGLTRPGIATYGGECVTGVANPMRPVVRLEARIADIRVAAAGETVSYGATAMLQRDTRIATCSVGYADGYPRAASGSGVPLRKAVSKGACGFVADRKVALIGRVTMDLTMFDITDCPADAVKPGDHIELIGPNMPLDDVARAAGTIGYELLTGLSRRYHRVVVNA